MSISITVKNYLDEHIPDYELLSHAHTGSSMESAGAAHVSGACLAKAVIVKREDDYMMVVVPSATFCQASWNKDIMPALTASSLRTPSGALLAISRFKWLVTSRYS